MQENSMTLRIDQEVVEVSWEDNEATRALKERLSQSDLSLDLSAYGGFEQVGSLGFSLPSDDKETSTSAGDIVLYNSNQLVLFYGSNRWSYTRLGRFKDPSSAERLLKKVNVKITLSLT